MLSDNVNQELPPKLVVINPKITGIEKEITFNEPHFIPVLIQISDNKIFVLDDDEKIKELDGDFKIVNTYSLQADKTTKIAREDKGIADIQVDDKKLYILYKDMNPKSKTNQLIAEIEQYDIQTGSNIGKTTLKLDKKWDDITFVVLER